VEALAAKVVEAKMNERFGAMQQQYTMQSALQQHVSELGVMDQQGRPIPNGAGGYMLNPMGQRGAQYVGWLEN